MLHYQFEWSYTSGLTLNNYKLQITNLQKYGSYSLDKVKELKVLQLHFLDSFSSLQLDLSKYNTLSMLDRIKTIEQSLDSLHSSSNKGFVNRHDLSTYPIFSELLPSFLLDDDESVEYLYGYKTMESYK